MPAAAGGVGTLSNVYYSAMFDEPALAVGSFEIE
jgi:hypothetical protein